MASKKTSPQTTPKQQRFIDCYDGTIVTSAKKAGLSAQYCRQLMSLPKYNHIRILIRNREATKSNNRIKTREARQQFWSDMMDKAGKDSDRLKASELLGKSEADFIERKRLEDPDGKPLKWQIEIITPKDDK